MAIWTKDDIARIIIKVGRDMGIAPRGIVIGLAVGLVESNLTVYANAKVPGSMALPHDAVGSDGMSVGVQQQQVVMGNGWWWGPVEVCQDPTSSTRLFFERLAKLDYNNTSQSPGSYAQAVQRSDYPRRYDERFAEAQAIYNRLVNSNLSGIPISSPGLPRVNVDWWISEFRMRVGNPYVYGGVFSPTNVRQGCDCSALAAHALNGVLFGPAMTWQRVDPTRGNAWITTESWRPIEVGQRGPFGTITVAHPRDFPADAAVKIALHHGPGGGANSHMWVEVDGVRMESNGTSGCVTGSQARSVYDTTYANDWAYLPGPIGTPQPADPWEELLMSDELLESVSIYATPGEGAKYTPRQMLQSVDGMAHRELVETAARLGDVDALSRIVAVAAGRGKYTDAAAITHARAVLTALESSNPAVLQAYLAQNGVK